MKLPSHEHSELLQLVSAIRLARLRAAFRLRSIGDVLDAGRGEDLVSLEAGILDYKAAKIAAVGRPKTQKGRVAIRVR